MFEGLRPRRANKALLALHRSDCDDRPDRIDRHVGCWTVHNPRLNSARDRFATIKLRHHPFSLLDVHGVHSVLIGPGLGFRDCRFKIAL